MKTGYIRKEDVERKWYLIDAKDKVLGRISTKIATLLIGKHKACYSAHVDMGDGVVVINSEKIRLTGKKRQEKFYKRFSGYPGGLRVEKLESLFKRRPHEILRHAVKGMLPKNKLGSRMIKRLKIYVGDTHHQIAQNPKELKV
ncbi:MAG: 50S ribosomal protein L13 [Omnitrophica bacterium RBG_13_46_9]|nr:MAG: 50S ribosomal protein L13 [Omnitrophica bacterium RBG_13_46_9]